MPDVGSTGTTERAKEIEGLIQRCRQGDLCAFTTLFERFQDRLYDLACAILHDGAEAEDAVQDTLLRVFQHIDRYRGDSSFETGLVAVAVNVCRDRLRRRRGRRTLPLDRLAQGRVPRWLARAFGGGEDPAAAVQRRERRSGLWALVDRLDDGQRLPLILRYGYGLSCDEVAEALGLRTGTVHVYLSRGRQQLRAMIEAQERQVEAGDKGRELC